MIQHQTEIACKFLDKYDIGYNRNIIKQTVEDIQENKSELIKVLSQHPNWNEKEQRVELDYEADTSYDINAHDEFVSFINDFSEIPKDIRDFFLNYKEKDFGKVTQEQFDMFKKYDLNFRANSKTNKSIGKVCAKYGVDKSDFYNQKFTTYSEKCGAKPKKQKLYLSVALVDFLSMAWGDSWSSCFAPTAELDGSYSGMHREGTMIYASDEVSFIVSVVDLDKIDEYGRVAPLNKRMHGAYLDGRLLTSLVYPHVSNANLSKEMRSVVQKIFAKCEKTANKWVKYRNSYKKNIFTYDDNGDEEWGYPDWLWNDSKLSSASVLENKYKEDDHDNVRVTVGVSEIRCLYCGEKFGWRHKTFYCENC